MSRGGASRRRRPNSRRRDELRTQVRARDGDDCFYCPTTLSFDKEDCRAEVYATLEHLVKNADAENHDVSNVVLSCRKCQVEPQSSDQRRRALSRAAELADLGPHVQILAEAGR